jgi:hypothetical protein
MGVSQLGRKLQRVLQVETLLAPSQESQKRRMADGLTEELTIFCGTRRHADKVLWNRRQDLLPTSHEVRSFNDMIYLLTAIGLSPGGSSTVLIYTKSIHRTTQLTTENINNN